MATLKTTIDQLKNELNAKIIYREIDGKGKALVPLNIVVVDPRLSIKEQEQITLHELEHIKKCHTKNSCNSPNHHSKQEAQAEHGRIQADLGYYITETPPEYWNTFNFLDYFGIDSRFEGYVNEQIRKYK